MTEIDALLQRLRSLDVRLWVAGDNLRYSTPPGAMSPELLAELRRHKPALMNALPRPAKVRQEATTALAADSDLVAIQTTGRRLPMFCPAPSGGTVYCYVELSRALGPDQPIYAFQTPGLDGKHPFLTSVEQLASRFIAQLRDVRPSGPYVLVAFSLGGLIAYEMAQQLVAAGHEVAFLGLIDTPTPVRLPGGMDDDVALLAALLRLDVPLHIEEIRSRGDTRAQLAYLLAEAQRAGVFDEDLELDQLCHFMKVHTMNNRAGRCYVPRPYPGRIAFFRAADPDPTGFMSSPDDPSLGWRDVPSHGIDLQLVSGNHLTMVASPHVGVLAARLSACLAAVQPAEAVR